MTERNRKVFKTPQQLEQPPVRYARLGLAEKEKLSNRLQIWKKRKTLLIQTFLFFHWSFLRRNHDKVGARLYYRPPQLFSLVLQTMNNAGG